MGVYDRQTATALRLIGKYGAAVLWRSIDREPADPSQPWKGGPNTTTEHDATVAFFPYSIQTKALMQQLAGTDVIVGADYGLMGRVNFVPTIGDEVITGLDGRVRTVQAIDPLAPNGEIILYTIRFGAME